MKQMFSQQKPDQVLMIYIDDKTFGIPIQGIQDVLTAQAVTHVPLADMAVKGVMNLRGRIVTVIDLPKYLGLSSKPLASSMNVVLEAENELFSFLVDRVGDVIRLDGNTLEDLPLTLNPLWRSVSSHAYPLPDTLMVILQPSTLFAAISNGSQQENRSFLPEGARAS